VAEIEKKADQAEASNITDSENAIKDGGVIAEQADQNVHGKAFEQTHKGDKTLSEPDMIAMNDGETVSQYKARVAQIQANRFGFFDSQEENKSSEAKNKSAATETGTVVEYQHEKIGDNFYASGIGYVDDSPARSTFDKLTDFCESAAARALDPDARKAYIQGQLDKLIGIGEGLNIAKDGTKAAAIAGFVALTDGTVANFLARPNAINEPLFHAVCGALDAMAEDPNAVNHALERVGSFVMSSSERYTEASNREKGQIIGETMFGMVNPEGSPEAAEAALALIHDVAATGDTFVWDTVAQTLKSIESMPPDLAEHTKKALFDYLVSRKLAVSQMERSARIPEEFFDNLAGKGGDWAVLNERASPDVVRQVHSKSCLSACGEMLTNGEVKQETLVERFLFYWPEQFHQEKMSADFQWLAKELGSDWQGGFLKIADASADKKLDWLLNSQKTWSAELCEGGSLGHAVIVDGIDVGGNICIRDPFDATKYEMTRQEFLKYWTERAVFRIQSEAK
jgi:hypothetical protein